MRAAIAYHLSAAYPFWELGRRHAFLLDLRIKMITAQFLRPLALICAAVLMALPAPSSQAQTPAPRELAIEQQFLTGLGLLNTGRPREAIPRFLAILADDPSLVRVRLELARAYFAAEQWERAREQFFIVLSGDVPDPVRLRVLEFIRAIDARRSVDWDIDLSLTEAGDGREFDTDAVVLDFGGLPLPSTIDRNTRTETALRLQTSVELRRPLELGFGGLGAPSGFARFELTSIDAPGSELDDATIGARAGLRFVTGRATTSLAPFYTQRYLGGDKFEESTGLTLSHERRFQRGLFVFGSLTYSDLENDSRDDLSGHQTQAFAGLSRSIGGQSSIGASVTITDKSVPLDLDNAITARLRFFGSRQTANGFVFEPALFVERKHFKTPSPLFTEDPDERTLGASLRIEKSDLFLFEGFTPYAEVEMQRTVSGVDAYSFRETEFRVGVERRF